MTLYCENCFCIYQKDGACLLGSIKIDSQGLCEDCIYPSVDKEKLEKVKEKYRKIL